MIYFLFRLLVRYPESWLRELSQLDCPVSLLFDFIQGQTLRPIALRTGFDVCQES